MVANTNSKVIMENTNYSLTGAEAQKLTPINKLGIALFVFGLLGMVTLGTKFGFLDKSLGLIFTKEWGIYISFAFMLIGTLLFTKHFKTIVLRTIHFRSLNRTQRFGLVIGVIGFGILAAEWFGLSFVQGNETGFLWTSLVLMALGIMVYSYGTYAGHTAGIKNNHVWFNSLTNGGVLGWVAGILLTLFYIQLYWFPDALDGMVRLFDPFAYLITGKEADRWFLYGTMYTFVILFLGVKFIIKYRHNRYQLIRTISVMFFQLVFAYMIPHIMEAFVETQGYFQKDLKNIWPLNYYVASDTSRLTAMSNSGVSGTFYFFWSIILFLVITPVLTYFAGKRWYCSWVCGCGGLAETAGDGFRQLSSKKELAWKIERWVIHSVMVFVLILSVAALWPYFSGKEYTIGFATINKTSYLIFTEALIIGFGLFFFWIARKYNNKVMLVGAIIAGVIALLLGVAYATGMQNVFFIESTTIKKAYGFLIGAAFSGVIGVGFYPILGNRVWCRFGCPMAGYMGLFQRFKSRFRITTNGAQCISCGNCSTYCEQGIDVRAYAQKGENIVRASCVGCGICSAVCPRGVLKLENGPEEGRFEPNPLEVTKDGVKLNL